MEVIKKFNSSTKIRLLINDGDTKRVETAHNYIKNNYNKQFEFESYNLLSEKIFELTIFNIKKSENEHHLIFIDPHGYKNIFKKDIQNIMESGKSEILIFLPVHQMYRFKTPKETNTINQSLERFIIEFELKCNAETPKEYIEHIKEAFSFNDKYYTTSYVLQSYSKNYYALFFITKNLKGLEKAVEAKWKLDELCGKGFEQKKAPTLFDGINEEEKKENCLEDLSKILKIYLKDKRNNNELYEFTLKNGFLLKHINEIMRILQNDNKLIFNRKIRKNSFYINYENHRDNNIKYEVQINE